MSYKLPEGASSSELAAAALLGAKETGRVGAIVPGQTIGTLVVRDLGVNYLDLSCTRCGWRNVYRGRIAALPAEWVEAMHCPNEGTSCQPSRDEIRSAEVRNRRAEAEAANERYITSGEYARDMRERAEAEAVEEARKLADRLKLLPPAELAELLSAAGLSAPEGKRHRGRFARRNRGGAK